MLTQELKGKLKGFLQDDAAGCDITSAKVPRRICRAAIKVNEKCVLAGVEEAVWLFESQGVKARALMKDGKKVAAGARIIELEGDNRRILSTERVALNVLGRMSGVASACADAVKIAKQMGKSRIAVTRKTSPGFQQFDKKAAAVGGALAHRANLADKVLLKENHLAFFSSVSDAIGAFPDAMKVEVEVETVKQAEEAARTGVGTILLDNFSPANAREAIARVRRRNGRVKIELSGGINARNLKKYADLGADVISMGELSKNAVQKDFSLDIL